MQFDLATRWSFCAVSSLLILDRAKSLMRSTELADRLLEELCRWEGCVQGLVGALQIWHRSC